MQTIIDVDLRALKEGLREGSIALVDVREDGELAAGVIPGSLAMPLSRFDPAALPDDGRRVVFSCAAGVRSRHAVALCRAAGLSWNEHFPDGYKGWCAAGEPVEDRGRDGGA